MCCTTRSANCCLPISTARTSRICLWVSMWPASRFWKSRSSTRRSRSRPSSSIWTSFRLPSAIRPTTPCACIFAKWARSRCSRAKAKWRSPSESSSARQLYSRRCHDRRWSSRKSSVWEKRWSAAPWPRAIWCRFPIRSSPTKPSKKRSWSSWPRSKRWKSCTGKCSRATRSYCPCRAASSPSIIGASAGNWAG